MGRRLTGKWASAERTQGGNDKGSPDRSTKNFNQVITIRAIPFCMATVSPVFLTPHAGHNKPYCGGLLWPVSGEGGLTDFTCSERALIVRSVPIAEVPDTIAGLLAKGNNVGVPVPSLPRDEHIPGPFRKIRVCVPPIAAGAFRSRSFTFVHRLVRQPEARNIGPAGLLYIPVRRGVGGPDVHHPFSSVLRCRSFSDLGS